MKDNAIRFHMDHHHWFHENSINMPCNKPNQISLKKLNPDLGLGDWNTLTEERYLASLDANGLSLGVEKLLRHYAKMVFPTDQAKIDALNRICHGARTNQANHISEALYELLSASSRTTIPQIDDDQPVPLQQMKDVTSPTHFGDMVFLPKNAEIIVIGDTHGDLASTMQIIDEIETSQAILHGATVVFLGDYTGNGVKNWENLRQILTFQRDNLGSVICLNGNHDFRETYLTALNEYFCVHWEDRLNPDALPAELLDKRPQDDNHYGHLRFDLMQSFGTVEGERIYNAFDAWGKRLPYICISDNLMMSHSVGDCSGITVQLSDLINAKQQDTATIEQIGCAAWKANKWSLHAAMVNNRTISDTLLEAFKAALAVNEFVVGHCHYRSGDTVNFGDKAITTIASSDPYSPDSGHYMYYEMVVNRNVNRVKESLPDGDAQACYLSFNLTDQGTRVMKKHAVSSET